MKHLSIIVLDAITCVPIVFFGIWGAWKDPFFGERLFWLSLTFCAILVMIPTVLLLKKKKIHKAIGTILQIIYAIMVFIGLWILLFDSTYGPWWELIILALSITAIVKSMYATAQLQMH